MPTDPSYISPREYLAIASESEDRYEYYDGEVVMMGYPTTEHERIVVSLVRNIGNFLVNKPCEVFSINMRACTPNSNAYMYPDVSIYCDEAEVQEEYGSTLKNPSVVFEVLSPSTARHDKGRKFQYYCQIPSLKEYMLIDPAKCWIEVRRKQPDDTWGSMTITNFESSLPVVAIGLQLPVAEVYRKIIFPG